MTTTTTPIRVTGPPVEGQDRVLTDEALELLLALHQRFEPERRELLSTREHLQTRRDRGETPGFLDDTRSIRESDWQVAETPPDLQDRRVEITGPVDRKMMINALNSGAKVFMADFEDALSPTWESVIRGQLNLQDAVRGTLELTTPEGKEYRLGEKVATLMVRPRGWHLTEAHVKVDGEPISASLFDFGLYVFHNAKTRLERGTAPYFYLPKLESHHEARLWNDVFVFAQGALGIPRGTFRATVLVETLMAAFEMEEILWELREHSAGLNAGRWDYIFSAIRAFRNQDFTLPDRAQVTMTVPFMRAYTEALVRACHKHGAHAMGGMAAFIPNRREPEVTENALAEVRRDKEREAGDGFDGTWVAHPDLVPVAMEVFDRHLGDRPHQKNRLREDVRVTAEDLLSFLSENGGIEGGRVTEHGVRTNVSVALQYLDAWLGGWGAAAIFNLMEDTATAEISRAQLWQWRSKRVKLADGRTFAGDLYRKLRDEELEKLGGCEQGNLARAAELLDTLVLGDELVTFLTWKAYPELNALND
jgi:malate synthase